MKRLFISFILGLSLLGFTAQGTAPYAKSFEGEQFLSLDVSASASVVQLSPRYEPKSQFLSEIYETDEDFQLLSLSWQEEIPKETAAHMEIRFRSDGQWTDWQDIHADQDGTEFQNTLESYFITGESDAFQYRADLSTSNSSLTPKLSEIEFETVNGGKQSLVSRAGNRLQRLIFREDSEVLSRQDWGADESYRFASRFPNAQNNEDDEQEVDEIAEADPDMTVVRTVDTYNGEELIWPEEYPYKVKKIIIHHTATTDDLDDPEAAIRAIYYYHSLTRGWGDIGYNFIIAPDGRVFQGRAGDDGVEAGHAAGYNRGSVGIAILGNYQEEPLPKEMVQSLTDLVYEKAQLHDIDVDAEGIFREEMMPNLMGHRDVSSTSCPGEHAYEYLPALRAAVASSIENEAAQNQGGAYAFNEVGDRELIVLDPQEDSNVHIEITNTGTATWNSAQLQFNPTGQAASTLDWSNAAMNESSVRPGAKATFDFNVEADVTSGLAYIELRPLFNGSHQAAQSLDLAVFVEEPHLNFSVQSSGMPSFLNPGESRSITVQIKNQGNITWTNSGNTAVDLVRSSTSSLVSSSTLARMRESSVAPGQTGTFQFAIQAPSEPGYHSLYVRPAMAQIDAYVNASSQLRLYVKETGDDFYVMNTSDDLSGMPGESKIIWIRVKNFGSSTWEKTGTNAFELAFLDKDGITIDSTPRIAINRVRPGVTTGIHFSLTLPNQPGDYTLRMQPRLGATALTEQPYELGLTVHDPNDFGITYDNPIRIRLTPDNAVSSTVVTSSTPFTLQDGEQPLRRFSAERRVRITPAGEHFIITSGSYRQVVYSSAKLIPETTDGVMRVLSMDQRPAWNQSLNDNKFRGSIEMLRWNGEVVMVNELGLEQYLQGVAEQSSNEPDEKIKAFAIAARSYAYYYMTQAEKFPGAPWHLDDDPDTSQKYLGYGFEQRAQDVVEGIQSTAGKIVTYNGRVVKTPYFSSSDGTRTKTAQSVWGWTDTPYLQSVSDAHCNATAFSGHGVGMSGCGAKALAESGQDYEDILRYYYTGIDIDQL